MRVVPETPSVTGLVLAAGAGRRMGKPKSTVIGADGVPWIVRSTAAMRGECDEVIVVLGAGRERAEQLLIGAGLTRGAGIIVVVADNWADGMGASLRAGLDAVPAAREGREPASAVLIHLVDLPDVGADVIGRVARAARTQGLARAAYHGVPGHPVLIGADHVKPLASTLHGDVGAKRYLAARDVRLIECGDLAGGEDVDFAKNSDLRSE